MGILKVEEFAVGNFQTKGAIEETFLERPTRREQDSKER
jgi:hypothetical protein